MNDDILIKKIVGGSGRSLLLSNDGDIYWIGNERQFIPKKVMTVTNKFVDVATHHSYEILAALSSDNDYYIWGYCENENIEEPKKHNLDHLTKYLFIICNNF